jgi:hypothetical protein
MKAVVLSQQAKPAKIAGNLPAEAVDSVKNHFFKELSATIHYF